MASSPSRIVRSALSWIRNERRRQRTPPRRIAAIMQTRNYDDGCSAFATMAELGDVTLVLDDRSSAPFPFRDRCTEYLSHQHPGPWNATASLTMLFYRAFVLGCEWVVMLDDDVIPGAGIASRSDVHRVIDRMEKDGLDACYAELRDLWDADDQYRTDGRWGQKTFALVRRNWFFLDDITLRDPAARLHTPVFPANRGAKLVVDRSLAVYHTGVMTDAARRARVDKYAREDPSREFQADYAYMLDVTGLTLAPVPPQDAAVIRGKRSPRAGAPGRPGASFARRTP